MQRYILRLISRPFGSNILEAFMEYRKFDLLLCYSVYNNLFRYSNR